MNLKLLLLVVGLIVGGAVGWMTAPKTSTVDLGPLHMEVQGGDNGNGGSATVTTDNSGVNVSVKSNSPLDDPAMRAAIFAAIGALVGFVLGTAVDRRRA